MSRQTQKIIILLLGVVLSQPFLVACNALNVDKVAISNDQQSAESLLKTNGLDVNSVDEGLLKAANAVQEGKMDLAQLYYVKTYELEPKNTLILQKMADLYLQLGKYNLAEVSLKLILKQEPKNLKVLEQYGLLLLKERKYSDAKLSLGNVIAKQQSSSAYNGLGIIANVEGDFQQAETLFRTANSILPNSPELLNNVGFALYSASKFDEALPYYNRALQINPRFKKALYNYALLQARLNNYDLAYSSFVKVSSEAEANNNLGYIAMMSGNYVMANNYLQEAIKLSPQFYKKANDNLRQLERLENSNLEANDSN
jgi:tetratricopeptide (TPR) repeat protein